MSIRNKAYIVGAYEHPTRKADTLSVAQLHADVARGAIADAGLSLKDIDGYFCAGDAPGLGTMSMGEYLGLNLRHVDSTETGGSAPLVHVHHAAQAIAQGKCNIALVTLAGRPRAAGAALQLKPPDPDAPELQFEAPFGPATQNGYAMCARRHMHEFGTTSEQLAWIKVAASHHAQHNPNAMLRQLVTVEDVVNSPFVSDPLHRLDCCVIKHGMAGKVDLTYSAARFSGPRAFEEAGLTPADIKYVSLYDSFTVTVLFQIEDLGFCAKGQGGRFVSDGNLISGIGKLPFNTDGGGLCNNHPANRGGMTKVIEAVRQLRGEAHPAVQVKNCDLALANGIGGSLATRHIAGTLIMERQ